MTKRDKILSIGFLVPVFVLGIYAGMDNLRDVSKPESGLATDQPFTGGVGEQSSLDKWAALATSERMERAKAKYRETKQLEADITEILKRANEGAFTVEMAGKAKIWRKGVEVLEKDIAEAGFDYKQSTPYGCMGQTHAALQSLKFAWARFERFLESKSEEDRESHSVAHSRELSAAREKLRYAEEWMNKGEY